METKVVNKRTHVPTPSDVYIGRPSKWGNPYSIDWMHTREEVIDLYSQWIKNQDALLNSLEELKGKNLVCWCSPKSCHGDVLVRLLNA